MRCKSRRTKNWLHESWHRTTIVCKQRWNGTESNIIQRRWQTIRYWRKRYKINFFLLIENPTKPASQLNIITTFLLERIGTALLTMSGSPNIRGLTIDTASDTLPIIDEWAKNDVIWFLMIYHSSFWIK